jgi:hypothetical protein
MTSFEHANNKSIPLKVAREKTVIKKEKQLCALFLHILEDPKIRNGKKNATFWDCVCTHY